MKKQSLSKAKVQAASDTVAEKEKVVHITLNIRRPVSFTVRKELVTLTAMAPTLVVRVSDLTQEILDKANAREIILYGL